MSHEPSQKNPAQWFAQAVTLHRAGNLGEAEALYRKVLELEADHTDTLTNLGTLYLQRSELEQGLRLLDRSIQLNPNQPEVLNNQGLVLHDLKRYDDALVSYDRALALDTNYIDAHNNRGNTLQQLKRYDEALAAFDKALSLEPNIADIYNNRGNTLQEMGRHEAALNSYAKALALNPRYVEPHKNRGNAFLRLEKYAEALAEYERALSLRPTDAEAQTNRGVVLMEMERYDDALSCHDQALQLNPNHPEAHNNRGTVLKILKRYDDALASYDKAISCKPDDAEVYHNRGIALHDVGRYEEALASYDKALSLKPDYANACFGKALTSLTLGNYKTGWEFYEWRWRTKPLKPLIRHFSQQAWTGGQNVSAKTILLYSEQGFGDAIQCSRYIPALEARGANVIVEVPPMLTGLISTVSPTVRVIAKGDSLPRFDYHCSLMSLPFALGTTRETIPSTIPYLSIDDERRSIWRNRLGIKSRRRIGLVWSGNPANGNDHKRSMPLAALVPLLDSGNEFHCLQKGISRADKELLVVHGVKIHEDALTDFSDAAALVSEMDLVLSVCTAAAHLAGALGKPVWVLLAYTAHYVWMKDGTNTPWYPTARLYRQPRPQDWSSVVAQVKTDLTK